MCWAALSIMIDCTIVTIYGPVQMPESDSILMAQYLALPGLVGKRYIRVILSLRVQSYGCSAKPFQHEYSLPIAGSQ